MEKIEKLFLLMKEFKLISQFEPTGDQPQAIDKLVKGVKAGRKNQALLGVTGSGKTFTIANLVAQINRPTLVIAHNKTLAAQLAGEFRQFFPQNAVEYFVSYYDYYQPEAYLPSTDVYIEKDLEINEEIDRLRHAATAALMSRRDVLVVASVSCIYGLGSPDFYRKTILFLRKGEKIQREKIIKKLVQLQYARSEILQRGKFRAKGETLEIMRPDRETIIRLQIREETIEKIFEYDHLSGEILADDLMETGIYPAKHFVVPEPIMQEAYDKIEQELQVRLRYFHSKNKIVEAERLRRRTNYDLEMMKEVGYVSGIENYSLYFSSRQKGAPPFTLLDYFPEDFLTVIDESHVTIPQLRAMYGGDYSRKKNLIDFGFRLPSAFDNRPLKFEEFEKKIGQAVYLSATPAEYELKKSGKIGLIEQVVRPTGLVDPLIKIHPCFGQVKDVTKRIKKVVVRGERVLVTALTKKMAEDLAEFLKEEKGIKAEYLHSEVDTLDRIKILENLRKGKIDVLVGVNLLREGLDLPEVSLVAILDADKEGFLRSETSLVQTIGRAARNIRGQVMLYADQITGSMERAIRETERRRKKQLEYNRRNKITPQTIKKKISSLIDFQSKIEKKAEETALKFDSLEEIQQHIKQREKEMKMVAGKLEFEKAALIRDEISKLKKMIPRK